MREAPALLPAWRQHPWRLLLFDLDDTLLRSDKTIPPRTLAALRRISGAGSALVGVSTSRSEVNAEVFTRELRPNVLITSAGAHVRAGERVIFTSPFTSAETGSIIGKVRELAGRDALLDADTPGAHYRNYPVTEHAFAAGFEDCVETDFTRLPEDPLMICAKLESDSMAQALREALPFADVGRFVNSRWHKITKKGVTKAVGIEKLCKALEISPGDIIAFGDDLADVEMLSLAGLGVAMGNAVPEVKAAADTVIGDNDSDAIADFLEKLFP